MGKGRIWFALGVLFAINLLNFYDRLILGAVGEAVRRDWAMTDKQLGWLGTAFILLYAAIGVPLGRWADRGNRSLILSGGVAVWSLLTGACGMARNYWQMFGLRLAVEHLAQFRGGICFCVDLDPRWVIKLIKKGWTEHLEAYKQHCIDQALVILDAGHDIRCMFTTPKLLEALCLALEKRGQTLKQAGIRGIFSGGTEFTPQWTRFITEEYLDGIYMTPTYVNTLMGLACGEPISAANKYKITYHAPQPRAVVEVVDFADPHRIVGYGETGRAKLYTLTKEFFMPGFLERDEGEREPPYVKYPWDGISGVRPFRELAEATTVGVY